MSKPFKLNSAFKPSGDQPEAIRRLEEGLEDGLAHQTLLGVTGSGKTFTIANVIADLQRPTMVLAPNKNAGGPVVWRNERVLPGKRGGIFRLLLRLLSAGSLCTEFRHLH